MKIRIDDIVQDGLQLNFSGEEEALSEHLCRPGTPGGPEIDPRIKGWLTITPGEDAVLISGELHVIVRLQCSRCLKQFPVEQELLVDLTVSRGDPADQMRADVDDAEEDTIFVTGPELDLDEVIVQEVLLEAPMKPLCRQDCPGLCPHCGELKGSPECTCKEQSFVDPRWEALAHWKKDGTQ